MKIPIITPKVRRDVLKMPNKNEAVLSEKDVRGSNVSSLNGLSKISQLAKRGLEDNCIKVSSAGVKVVNKLVDKQFIFDSSHNYNICL